MEAGGISMSTGSLIPTESRWEGAEQLRQFLIPVDEIQNHPENPRRGDVNMIADSLGFFGQLKPIILHTYAGQSVPYVVAGNHTLRGAKAEVRKDGDLVKSAWTHVAAVTPDITDEQADEFLLMDNRSSDLAENDNALLAPMLQKLMDSGRLDRAGYTADDYDDLLASLDAVATVEEQPFTGDYAESAEDTAARFTTPGEGVRMKEALLMYPEDQFEEFTSMMRSLREEWGIESARGIVFEALRRCTGGQPAPDAMPGA
jgi:hypothetical protein